jgi:hypothetical protein
MHRRPLRRGTQAADYQRLNENRLRKNAQPILSISLAISQLSATPRHGEWP